MNKPQEMFWVLVLAMILLFFGLTLLTIGKNIYGPDASLLWVSGILTYMGIRGLGVFILYLWELKDAKRSKNDGD